jgi:peroxiredoxin
MKRFASPALLVGIALLLALAGCTSTASVGTRKGDVAPDFSLPTLDGGAQSLSDYKGRTVILNFWASWCGPCRAEMPDMQVVYGELREQDLVVVGVNQGEPRQQVEAFVQEFGLTFPVLLDEEQGLARTYGVRAFPTTFIIDGDGIIRDQVVGGPLSRSALLKLVEGAQK